MQFPLDFFQTLMYVKEYILYWSNRINHTQLHVHGFIFIFSVFSGCLCCSIENEQSAFNRLWLKHWKINALFSALGYMISKSCFAYTCIYFRTATIRSAPTGPDGQNGVHAVQLVWKVFKHDAVSVKLDNLASLAVWDNSTLKETASQATALGPLGQNSVHVQLLAKEEFSRGEATSLLFFETARS